MLAASAAGGLMTSVAARAATLGNPDNPPQGAPAISGHKHSASDPGPRNGDLAAQFPDSELPPATDHGNVENFWFPFAQANRRVQAGGWSREVTERELPIAKTLAGVDMRLTAGGVRELHWHKPAEWGFVLYGNARITGFDQAGRSFVNDVTVGDLWNFPSGSTGKDDLVFLEVFRSSYYASISFSEWLSHLPPELVKAHFRFSDATLDAFPKDKLTVVGA